MPLSRNLPKVFVMCFVFLLFSCEKTKLVDAQGRSKKSLDEKMMYSEERTRFEYDMQKNPITGKIPEEELKKELENTANVTWAGTNGRMANNGFVFRGPSNLGGRTRALAYDLSDATGNTILAGGVSSGMFRSVDGGSSWVRVSANDEIHNVTALAQDPRPGFQNIWYYGTGEFFGNSATLGSSYFGGGIWKSTDSGVTWSVIPATSGNFTLFDSQYDFITDLAVNPQNGDLIVGAYDGIFEIDFTTNASSQILGTFPSNNWGNLNQVEVANNGDVYATINSNAVNRGFYRISNGTAVKLAGAGATQGAPGFVSFGGRTYLHLSDDQNTIYLLSANNMSSTTGQIEANLYRYSISNNTYTNFTSKVPDEPGGNLAFNDPFSIQNGYDIVLTSKPGDADFVVIGGTNAYVISDINSTSAFTRIGGYASRFNYALYSNGGDIHHPDIHALVFNPFDTDVLLSGTDGGVHRMNNVTFGPFRWVSLNNDYRTYQYYHVNLHPDDSNDTVIGGAQDNGTTWGGSSIGAPNQSNLSSIGSGDGCAVALVEFFTGNATPEAFLATQNGNLRRRINSSSIGIEPTGSTSIFITYFYSDPNEAQHLYYAGRNTLYTTSNAQSVTSGSWTNVASLPSGEDIRSMVTNNQAYSSLTSFLVMGTSNGRVLKLTDPINQTNFSNLQDITPTGASTNPGTIVSSVSIHPTNHNIGMVTYSNYGINSIYVTSNLMDTNPAWILAERNLSAHSIRSSAIASSTSGGIVYYVGTARGLYSSSDPQTTDWVLEGGATIGIPVVSSLAYRASDNKLLVGTHGNGMWETTAQFLSTGEVERQNSRLEVYPNPTVDAINFSVQLENQERFAILNAQGQLVKRGIITPNNKQISVRGLPAGIYFIQTSINGKPMRAKFVKR